ncbi:MAG: hypothetical protein ACI8QC_004118, partial [Planctomycetota bacterium]
EMMMEINKTADPSDLRKVNDAYTR